ncbi:MAG: hypothetical protein GF393_00620 [Armatimonadia bacterium]|nr:hypothetical protein [Armatimonadia bacterium]
MFSRHSARVFSWVFSIVGAGLYLIMFGKWDDPTQIVYDVVAAPVVFAFVARALVDGLSRPQRSAWIARAALLIPMIIVFFSSQFGWWNISAHLIAVLLTLAGTLLARRSLPLVMAALTAAVTVGYIRWFIYDSPSHDRTWNTFALAAVALTAAVAAEIWMQLSRQRNARANRPHVVRGPRSETTAR